MATPRTVKALVPDGTPPAPPWQPVASTYPEVSAIHALSRGDANPEQQALVMRWLAKATAVNELEFRPDGERESNFAAGKRFVGIQFFALVKTELPKE